MAKSSKFQQVKSSAATQANSAWSHTKAFTAKPVVRELATTAAMTSVVLVTALGVMKGAKAVGLV